MSIRTAAIAGLFGALVVSPAFAQDPGAMNCADFSTLTPEEQTAATTTLIMGKFNAEVPEETVTEATSMLLEKCNEFPDQMTGAQFDELPLEISN